MGPGPSPELREPPLSRLLSSTLSFKIPSLPVNIRHGGEGCSSHFLSRLCQIGGSRNNAVAHRSVPETQENLGTARSSNQKSYGPRPVSRASPADDLVRAATTASAHSVVRRVRTRAVQTLLRQQAPLRPSHPLPWQRHRRPRACSPLRKTGT